MRSAPWSIFFNIDTRASARRSATGNPSNSGAYSVRVSEGPTRKYRRLFWWREWYLLVLTLSNLYTGNPANSGAILIIIMFIFMLFLIWNPQAAAPYLPRERERERERERARERARAREREIERESSWKDDRHRRVRGSISIHAKKILESQCPGTFFAVSRYVEYFWECIPFAAAACESLEKLGTKSQTSVSLIILLCRVTIKETFENVCLPLAEHGRSAEEGLWQKFWSQNPGIVAT